MSLSHRWRPPNPLDLSRTIQRYSRYGYDLTNVVQDGYLYRTTSTGHPYRIRQLTNGTVEIQAKKDLETAVAETRFRLGETLPIAPVQELAQQIPALAQIWERIPGYRPPINPSVIASLITSICSQQVNLTWAATTRRRLVERYGTVIEWEGVQVWGFPDPQVLADADPAEIRAMQFSTRKAEYIVGVGKALSAGLLDGLAQEENDQVIARITDLRGLGRWTAEWFLARCLARPDVVAAGDLGVRKTVSRLVARTDQLLTEQEVRDATATWGDAGNLAIHLLLEAMYSPS